MDVLDTQTVADDFPADGAAGAIAQLGPIWGSNGGYYNIESNPVYAQYGYGDYGSIQWTPPVPIPVGPALLTAGTVAVRFKNFTAGAAAVVSGALAERGEPQVQITAGGVAAPGGVNNVAASVTDSVNFAVPSNGLVFQTFDTIKFDPFGFFNPANPTRLTVPAGKDGLYLITFTAEFSASAAGTFRQAVARLNGVTVVAQDMRPPVGGGNVTITNFSTVAKLAAADYIEIRLLQDSGVGLNSDAQPWSPIFSLAQLAV